MKKKIAIFFILSALLFIPCFTDASDELNIDCTGGAILVEYKTSNVVFKQDADKKWAPASLAKVMTAVVALEEGNLNEEVRFSANAAQQEKSNLGLDEGVRVPLYKLIEAMLVKSGNDAAVAIAEHIDGTEKTFAERMNRKARNLGMFNTNFTNASGLPDDDQYSTAIDLANLAIYAMRQNEFSRIVCQSELEFINEDGTENRTIYTTNRLLGRHPLVDGIKTGFTNKAQHCLAASAAFRDYRLISIVLGADSQGVFLSETEELLDYGFELHDPLYPLYRDFRIEITHGDGNSNSDTH